METCVNFMFDSVKIPPQDGEKGKDENGTPSRESCGNSERGDELVAPKDCHPENSLLMKSRNIWNFFTWECLVVWSPT